MAALVYGVWQAQTPVRAAVTYDGVVIAIGTLTSIPVQIAVLVFAAQQRGGRRREYFALAMPQAGRNRVCRARGAWRSILAFDVLLYVTRWRPCSCVPDRSLPERQGCRLAPRADVRHRRGRADRRRDRVPRFPLPGLGAAGPRDASPSALSPWSGRLLHIQYDWLGMAQVFATGLMLGWFRWASGSTALTIVMHAIINLEAMIETAIKAEWLS